MHLDELFDYKNELAEKICSTENIVKLIVPRDEADTVETPKPDLMYTQVFPYEFVPETVTQGKTFICLDIDIESVKDPQGNYNRMLYMPVIFIWMFTHKSNLRLPEGGVRLDKLAKEINYLMNGSRELGIGELSLDSLERFVPIKDFQGKVLTYYALDFSGKKNLGRIPGNRKVGL